MLPGRPGLAEQFHSDLFESGGRRVEVGDSEADDRTGLEVPLAGILQPEDIHLRSLLGLEHPEGTFLMDQRQTEDLPAEHRGLHGNAYRPVGAVTGASTRALRPRMARKDQGVERAPGMELVAVHLEAMRHGIEGEAVADHAARGSISSWGRVAGASRTSLGECPVTSASSSTATGSPAGEEDEQRAEQSWGGGEAGCPGQARRSAHGYPRCPPWGPGMSWPMR